MSTPDSRKVVVAALIGNLAICVCKFVAAYLSRSTATFAEALHSVADTGNQALLLLGMRLAARPPDVRFPFGRSGEMYFWPFVVALLLFSVGGTFAIYEGVTHFGHAGNGGSPWWSYGVLGISTLFELLSFRVAYAEFRKLAAGRPWAAVMLEARDPTIPLVLAEDASALLGLVIAFVAVLLAHTTGVQAFDPAGSVLIGVLLSLVAVVLATLTHGLLIGKAASVQDQAIVLRITEGTPGVEKVTQLLTFHVGPDVVILAMKVAFRADDTVAGVEDTINRAEERIRAELPHMRKIFIEPDARGDGRGLAAARAHPVAPSQA
jgi:cation diffusion facilitator family transporter